MTDWRIAPREVSDAMNDAAFAALRADSGMSPYEMHCEIFAAMIAASPDPLDDEALVKRVEQAVAECRRVCRDATGEEPDDWSIARFILAELRAAP